MKALHTIAAAAAMCVAGISPALAQSTTTFSNGSFADGLIGWSAIGDVIVTGPRSVAALTTASLDFDDDAPLAAGFNNRSGVAAADFFLVPDLAGVSFSDLDAAGGDFTYEGSAIRQDFFATAGDILTVSFDWTFLSADSTNLDFGFLTINDTVVNFVDSSSAPATSQFLGQFGDFSMVNWGWSSASYTYTAASTGAVSLVLGVVDIGDASFTSELRVDNIAVTAVPEPESVVMLLAGLGLVGGAVARRRRALATTDRSVS